MKRSSNFCKCVAIGASLLLSTVVPGDLRADRCDSNEEFAEEASKTLINDTRIRAIMIMAEFADGEPQPYECGGAHPWPKNDSNDPFNNYASIPAWADDLLQDEGVPIVEGSITNYYNLITNNQLNVYGDVHPRVVYLDPMTSYNAGTPQELAFARAVNDAITRADADGLDFSQFDIAGNADTPDGIVDLVLVYFREKTNTNNGSLWTTEGCDDFTPAGKWFIGGRACLMLEQNLSLDGKTIDRDHGVMLTPHTAIINFDNSVEIAAHEIGHGAHPYHNVQQHNSHVNYGGYSIMHGTTGWAGISALLPVQQRKTQGWLDPKISYCLDPANCPPGFQVLPEGVPVEITLEDVIASPNESTVQIQLGPSGEVLYIECRDASSNYFTNGTGLNPGIDPCEPRRGVSGILLTHIRNKADLEFPAGLFDIETGEPDHINGLDELTSRITTFPDAVGPDAYTSFLPAYGPGMGTVYGPYTNPSSNLSGGISSTEDQSIYSGLTLYNFEWIQLPDIDGTGEMKFTILYEGKTPPVGPHILPDDMTWNGLVHLNADVEVAPGEILTVTEEATVVSSANQDASPSGPENEDPDRVEIIVKGNIDVRGTIASDVLLTTSDDSDFHDAIQWTSAPPVPDPDGWYGIRFDRTSSIQTTGCSSPADAHTSLSWLEMASIRNGLRGLAIENTEAPSIVDVSFNESHIYLDETDTYVPLVLNNCSTEGGWILNEGTEVRVSSATIPTNDISGGRSGIVDVIAHGPIQTISSDPDLISFGPDNPPQGTSSGSEWGGVILDARSAGSSFTGTDLSHAVVPLQFNNPESALVDNCRIRQFAEKAIFARDCTGTGLDIMGTLIERGNLDSDSKGLIGIQLARCYQGLVHDNQLDLPLPGNSPDGAGIRILNQTVIKNTMSSQSLEVSENSINGLVESPGFGIDLDWGDDVLLESNDIKDFAVGVRMTESKDIQLTCNSVSGSSVGVFVSSNFTANPGMRFRSNTIHASNISIDTDNGLKTKLGPVNFPPTKGKNLLRVDPGGSLIHRTDNGSMNQLKAGNNTWRVGSNLLTSEQEVRNNCTDTDNGALVAQIVASPTRSDDFSSCGGFGGFQSDNGASDQEVDANDHPPGPVFPIPFRRSSRLQYTMESAGLARIEIYSVSGRLARTLIADSQQGGRHQIAWDGRSSSGQRLGSGVYFVKYSLSSEKGVKRLVLID